MKAIGVTDTNRTCMERDDEQKPPVFGEAIQAAMAARGHELTLAESQEFAKSLLRLFELGAFIFYDADGNEVKLPGDSAT